MLGDTDSTSARDEAMTFVEFRRGRYLVSSDKAKLDLHTIHDWLSNRSYWAQGRPLSTVENSIEHSLCFGVYEASRQVGFARVVTDRCTFAWLCDVFVMESRRGLGLGKWLVECIVAHSQLQDLSVFVLATTDAHELYRRHGGFEVLDTPEKWMVRRHNQPEEPRPAAKGKRNEYG